jgi:alkanesulfonate monooxygenase SsuD/methylene tetrahydromethanopterin reductase-like flavin-dependent oxidoreductase (luciferase family)/endonuclease YncB( thermonuclease family)
MRFGLFYEHQIPRPWDHGAEHRLFKDALEQIEIADRVGFDYVWEVEHHFLEEYSHSSAPEVFLAAASQRTRRIRLGHGIVQLPPAVNHPARVAERIATLDLVCDGRLDFGTGESSSAAELGGFLVDRQAKRAQWEDAIDAITRMFVEEPFAGWSSPYFRMPPRHVLPRPHQKPHPPLWVACSRRETIQFAATKGIGALSFSFVEPEDAGKWVRDYYDLLSSDACVPAGFAVNPAVAVVLPAMLHADEQTAIERGIDGAHFFGYALSHYYGLEGHAPGRTDLWKEFQQHRASRGFARHLVRPDKKPLGVRIFEEGIGSLRGAVGTPDQVRQLLRRYEAVGVDQVAFVLQAGDNRHEHICESLELLGREVLPAFAEGREAKERAKAERLAPAVEAALARRSPPRGSPPSPYRIDEPSELERARRAARASRPLGALAKDAKREAVEGARRRVRAWLAAAVRDKTDAELTARFGNTVVQWAIFGGMARAFDPRFSGGFQGEVEYELLRGDDGAISDRWTLRVQGKRAVAVRTGSDRPAFRLRIPLVDFARVLGGQMNPYEPIVAGRAMMEGDIELASRLTEMFGGPTRF